MSICNRIKKLFKAEPKPPEVKRIDIRDLTDENLQKLGRTQEDVYYSVNDALSSFVADKEIRTVGVYAVRNKRTGRVVMARGNAESLRNQFNNEEYEIIEAQVKGDEE